MSEDSKNSELPEELFEDKKKKFVIDLYRELREETHQLIDNILEETLTKISEINQANISNTERFLDRLTSYLINRERDISKRLDEIYEKLPLLNEMIYSTNPRERNVGIWYAEKLRREVYSLMVEEAVLNVIYDQLVARWNYISDQTLYFLRDSLKKFSEGTMSTEEIVEGLEKITGKEIRSKLRDIEYSILDNSFLDYLPRNNDKIKKILDNIGNKTQYTQSSVSVSLIFFSFFIGGLVSLILSGALSKTGMFSMEESSATTIILLTFLFIVSFIFFKFTKDETKFLLSKKPKNINVSP
jgi:tetrahydromethanopterin S-methyltransferase subunit G